MFFPLIYIPTASLRTCMYERVQGWSTSDLYKQMILTHTHSVSYYTPAAFSAPDPTYPHKGQSAEPRDN